jgi:F-type H+-transporting ATPase subunit b
MTSPVVQIINEAPAVDVSIIDAVGHTTASDSSGIMHILSTDTGIWVALSFILFAFIAYKLGGKSVVGKLDGKIQEIKDEIENAERIRVEAQELLAQYQRKQQDAEKEAKEMVKNAKAQARAIKKTMQIELDETITRREAQLADRMKRLEENAIAQIQNKAADVAVAATTQMILSAMDEKTQKALVESSVDVISKQLN